MNDLQIQSGPSQGTIAVTLALVDKTLGDAAVEALGGKIAASEVVSWARTNLRPDQAEAIQRDMNDPRMAVNAARRLGALYQQAQRDALAAGSVSQGGCDPTEVAECVRLASAGNVAAQQKLARTPMALVHEAFGNA